MYIVQVVTLLTVRYCFTLRKKRIGCYEQDQSWVMITYQLMGPAVYSLVHLLQNRAGIFKESMGARNRGGRGLSYRPARLHRLAEFIPWNRFRGPIHV
jgi:hypothetical protein